MLFRYIGGVVSTSHEAVRLSKAVSESLAGALVVVILTLPG